MPREVLLSPSLQCADPLHVGDAAARMERAGADMLHIDVMDMRFVPNLALSFDVIAALKRRASLPLDAHIMATPAEEAVLRAVDAGADCVCWHVESAADHRALLRAVRARGRRAGLALSPETPPEALLPYLSLLDAVILMGVRPGFAGQPFLPETPGRVRTLCGMRSAAGAAFTIEVDGGIDLQSGADCARAGADILVAGAKCVFLPRGDIGAHFLTFKNALQHALFAI